MTYLLSTQDSPSQLSQFAGGKASNLAKLDHAGFPVPAWVCVSSEALREFLAMNRFESALEVPTDLKGYERRIEDLFLGGKLPTALEAEVTSLLNTPAFEGRFVAVRSSGLDEDSADHSFAGQFSSFLFQKGVEAVTTSLKRCWASAFSERALSYRRERGLPLSDIRMGVVIQAMINAESAGVAFSRNPIRPLDRDTLIISSVFGLGEGLVSGELDSDNFEVHRKTLEIKPSIAEKTDALRQAPEGGLIKTPLPEADRATASLADARIREIARLSLALEERLGSPQDCEWAIEAGKLYFVQTRPITSLPDDAFFDAKINGDFPILWDNSNIIESYSGVTSPLTFSFASSAYRQVYIQFCEVMGVPREAIRANEPMFRNMLGLIRGRIYYNLIHWYQLVLMLPGASNNKGFMETMMGVKQKLKPELMRVFDIIAHPPRYSSAKRLWLGFKTLLRFKQIDGIIHSFQTQFNETYERTRKVKFENLSLTDQAQLYQSLEDRILKRWHAPIINDYLCMVFFGLLKKLTENWLASGDQGASLQNDLLCGEGDLESTEPTKMLMRIAAAIDHGDAMTRQWIVSATPAEIWHGLQNGRAPEVAAQLHDFLDRYGFRCINELKLEEPDLHDDPSFVLNAISSYVRMKSYSIETMEERERAIRTKAEAIVREKLKGAKLAFYFWIVKQARKAVRNRENLRFARTKIFGVIRHLFRGMGANFVKLGLLSEKQDIFYLTVEELLAFIEGRAVSLKIEQIVAIRKAEWTEFRETPAPPDRLVSTGAAGLFQTHPLVLSDADLMRDEAPLSDDPNVLLGTPCSPGVIEGVVRVVERVQDAEGMGGEILVTARTDPGWVPLYPSCGGLLIERGSLLSHSAVVARELGLPTIVGISGGLMKKLKTGQRVRIDAGKGEVRILS